MNTLQTLGILSTLFVIAFTTRAYFQPAGVGQTPQSAIIEAYANLAIGFFVNYTANLLIFPMIGARINLINNIWLGMIYTAISIVRQYAIRRWFNAKIHAAAIRLSGAAA
jgi:hypothetical protein